MLCGLPVAGLGLDFVRGREANLTAIRAGFPAGKLLFAGVVDGRNIWRADLNAAYAQVQELARVVSPERIVLSASCSLLHLPETVSSESAMPVALKRSLSFARERIEELALLSAKLRGETSAAWEDMELAVRAWKNDASRFDASVQKRVDGLASEDFRRLPYAERKPLQDARLALPKLPTTTIGSFPQTPELRKARSRREEDPAGYALAIREEIESVVRLQEEIGLDVLVHGEPERNDMVQFFGDQMRGFATMQEGWVQSYGSRCVRPPIIFGDVARLAPMTVDELRYAQSLTSKPMKGMLTGPITILQWSFVREDVPRSEVAFQIALAIRDEVEDLEEIGLSIVQIDEAAFREGLPLRLADQAAYSDWAVRAFKLATSGARPETQIHTHMCYSEFGDMIDAIAAMDADVISIEDARSEGALLETLKLFAYPQQIGPGVYDIHSPNVPTVEFVVGRLESTLQCLPSSQVWVNPDCGLKTRRYEEVVPSLRNMVTAARKVREKVSG
jgi:5-methyltetrahydropteroyltriglutamate--homocysteine methyltransferase